MDENLMPIISLAMMSAIWIGCFLAAIIIRLTPPKIKIVFREKEVKVHVDKEVKIQYTLARDKVDKLCKIYHIPYESAKHLPDRVWETLEQIHTESITDKATIRKLSETLHDSHIEFEHLKKVMKVAFSVGGVELNDDTIDAMARTGKK